MGKVGALRKKYGKPKKSAGAKESKEEKEERAPSPQIELLDDVCECTPAFKRALVELFARFDVDGDKLLSEAELKAFSRAANEDEREFAEEEMMEIKDFFDWKEGPAGAGLTLRGWMQMYMTQTQAREEETWEDLHRLGYNGRLELRPAPSTKAEGELRAKLEELLALGEAGKLKEFVDAFVAPDVDQEDRDAFLETLSGKGAEEDTLADDVGQLQGLLAELRCCLTGDGVFKVEGDQEEGPATFHFRSPAPGMHHIDREVVFLKEEGRWCAEG